MALAFVCITSAPKAAESVLKEIRKVDRVVEAFMVYGNYDVVATVEGDTLGDLKRIITEKIRGVKGVKRTLSMVVVE